jgi:serine/threonine protein kinase
MFSIREKSDYYLIRTWSYLAQLAHGFHLFFYFAVFNVWSFKKYNFYCDNNNLRALQQKVGIRFPKRSDDIWSLGVLLYTLLTKEFPWKKAQPIDLQFCKFIQGDFTCGPWSNFSPVLIQVWPFRTSKLRF